MTDPTYETVAVAAADDGNVFGVDEEASPLERVAAFRQKREP